MDEHFTARLSRRWHTTQAGAGQLVTGPNGLLLALARAGRQTYADAQIDDYSGVSGSRGFAWRPPLRLSVRARASAPLLGTAGFGFWNNPLGGAPRLPAAIWFFYGSAPGDLPLALGVPGQGWKAACIDCTQASALAWAPLAPPVLLLNRIPALYRRIWPRVQRALRIAEAPIPALGGSWATYTIEWLPQRARFAIDGREVLSASYAPRGPLGFVAWIDNQWAVVTPQGRFGWGMLDTDTQWMEIQNIHIETLM